MGKRRSRAASYVSDVHRRTIQVLLAIRPNAPFPIELLSEIISGDSMTGGPFDDIGSNLQIAPSTTADILSRLQAERHITLDKTRKILTVTAAGQAVLKARFAQMPITEEAKWRMELGLDAIEPQLVVEMFEAASYRADSDEKPLSLDQMALMVPHLLLLAEKDIASNSEDWGPAQILATLWFLYESDIVSSAVIAEQTNRLLAICEARHLLWEEWLAVNMLHMVADTMLECRWPETPHIEQVLTMTDTILAKLSPEEKGDLGERNVELHKRLSDHKEGRVTNRHITGGRSFSLKEEDKPATLEEIKARLAAITPGKWQWSDIAGDVPHGEATIFYQDGIEEDVGSNDGERGLWMLGAEVPDPRDPEGALVEPVLVIDETWFDDEDDDDENDNRLGPLQIAPGDQAFIEKAPTDMAALIAMIEQRDIAVMYARKLGTPSTQYEVKFANLIRLCEEAEEKRAKYIVVAVPEVLGDTFEEVIASLKLIRASGLTLQIAHDPREPLPDS